MHCPSIVLVAFCFILLVTADMNSLEKRGGRRYCGETLNNVLMFLCEGVYNFKRSGSTDMDTVNWSPNEPMVVPFFYREQSYLPFKPRDNAVSLIPRQYKRRGVADECCSKPCTLAELSSYCGVRSR